MRMRQLPVLMAGLTLSMSALAAPNDQWTLPVNTKNSTTA